MSSLANKKVQLGLIFSFLVVLFDVFYDVGTRVAAVAFDIKPMVFVFVVYISAGLGLLMLAGPGRLGAETLKSPYTWLFNGVNVLLTFFFLGIIHYVTATESNMVVRISVTIIILYHFLFSRTKVQNYEWLIAGMIALGYGLLIADLPEEHRVPVMIFGGLYALVLVVRALVSEAHPASNSAQDKKEEIRVTAYITLSVGYLFLFISLLGAALNVSQEGSLSPYLPVFSDFIHVPSILFGIVVGLVFEASSMFFFFKANKVGGSKLYTQISALLPAMTLLCEYLVSLTGVIDIDSLSRLDVIALALMTTAAILSAIMRTRNPEEEEKEESLETYEHHYGIAFDAIEFCNGNFRKAAELLDVPMEMLEKVHLAQGAIGFDVKPKKLASIERKHRRRIVLADPLTALPNQKAIKTAISGALVDKSQFAVIFIDLNKFKPINDTHGHEAGNAVLVEIGRRLESLTPKTSIVGRYGGDEFVIILRHHSAEDAQELISELEEKLLEPIQVEGVAEFLHVGASFGVSEAFKDADDYESLIQLADEGMYRDKKNKGEER